MLDSMSSGARSGAGAVPVRMRSTLAWVSGSRPPAPIPISATAIAGCGPHASASVVSRAAPVGVHDSALPGPARDGTPRSSSATAGGGTGMVPCAPRTVPEPTATGETVTGPPTCSASQAKPAQTPTTSAIASSAPTSWKATSRGSAPCTRASATASRSKVRVARSRTSSSSSARWSRARMSRQLRWCCESAISTWQRVAAKPLRVTASGARATGSGATASTARPSTSRGTPAPRRAPSSMSPLAPADASTQTLMRAPRSGRPWRAHPRGGRCGRRRRRRRTRCRC